MSTLPEATKKISKISRSRTKIANKVIAFEEILSSNRGSMSERGASKLVDVPNSTMQSWRIKKSSAQICPELNEFLSGAVGQKFIHTLFMAVYIVVHYGCGGVRALKDFLHLSKLNLFIASSEGALQAFSVRCEEHIISFGYSQEKLLAEKMKRRKISAGLDEIYRGRHPCLVAIELVSGYILVEKFTEDRTAETWTNELKPRLEEINVEVDQVVSDLAGSIRAVAKEIGASHTPELFHAQHEITKATSAGLAAQEKKIAQELLQAENQLEKAIKKHGESSVQVKEATIKRNLKQFGYQLKRERSQKVRTAKKDLGALVHPINIETGNMRTAENAREECDKHLTTIEKCAKEAELSPSSQKGLAKARRAFEGIMGYLTFFFIWWTAFLDTIAPDKRSFFKEVVFPLSYLQMIWKRLKSSQREALSPLKTCLEKRFRENSYSEAEKDTLMGQGRMCAEKFQRSSSCVEGRNGMLSLYHHRFHRLNERSCKALTVVHNFHKTRSDGTTAAERFFGSRHESLFESLVSNVRIPGMPLAQSHNKTKREQKPLNLEKHLEKRVA